MLEMNQDQMKGMCLRDLIHENTFVEDEPFHFCLVFFNYHVFNLSSLLESFSMFCCWVFPLLCCWVFPYVMLLSHVLLNFQINVTLSIKMAIQIWCIMWSLFASFEMNEFLNLRHWLIQIGIKRWDCLSSLDHKEQAWKWERGGEIERKKRRLQSSEIVHKNEKDE